MLRPVSSSKKVLFSTAQSHADVICYVLHTFSISAIHLLNVLYHARIQLFIGAS